MLMRTAAQLSILLLGISTVVATTAQHETVSFDGHVVHICTSVHSERSAADCLRALLHILTVSDRLLRWARRWLALPLGPCRIIATCPGASATRASAASGMQRREAQDHVSRKRHRAVGCAMQNLASS